MLEQITCAQNETIGAKGDVHFLIPYIGTCNVLLIAGVDAKERIISLRATHADENSNIMYAGRDLKADRQDIAHSLIVKRCFFSGFDGAGGNQSTAGRKLCTELIMQGIQYDNYHMEDSCLSVKVMNGRLGIESISNEEFVEAYRGYKPAARNLMPGGERYLDAIRLKCFARQWENIFDPLTAEKMPNVYHDFIEGNGTYFVSPVEFGPNSEKVYQILEGMLGNKGMLATKAAECFRAVGISDLSLPNNRALYNSVCNRMPEIKRIRDTLLGIAPEGPRSLLL